LKQLVLLPLMCVALAASAAMLKTDITKSTVSAVFKQMNVPVESQFKKYTVAIDYDSAKPDAAKASVEVDTATLDIGDADMNKEVAKQEWFNSAQFPKASFVSSAIKYVGPGQLRVTGKLSIKGKSAEITFPVTVKADGGRQVFDGILPIRRLAFNIGDGAWKDTGMVADEVTIKIHVVAGLK
jgi:polyisoprenoid-binding protein YceI